MGDGEEKTGLRQAMLPLIIAGAAAMATWGWTFVKADIDVRAEAAGLRAENSALQRQAALCQDITEQAMKLVTKVKESDK